MRGWAGLIGLVVMVLLVAHLASPSVSAHAVLLESVPADGELLAGPPAEVALRFNESVEVTPDGIRVLDPEGERVDLEDARHGDTREWVRVSLSDTAEDGTYLASWEVLSADGHVIRGSLVFHIGERSSGGPPDAIATPSAPPWVDTAAAVVRWIAYAAALLAAGIVAFLLLVHDRNAAERSGLFRAVAACALVALVAAPLSIFTESLVFTLGDIGDALDPDRLRVVVESGHGTAALLLAIAAVWLFVAATVRNLRSAVVMVPGAALVAAGFAWRGHSAAADPAWLGLAANILHTVAAAVWFGGLVSLGAVVWRRYRRDEPGTIPLVRRFSGVALVAFLLVVIGGVILSIQILTTPGDLVETGYGQLLIAKLVLVAIVVALAAYHRFRIARNRAAGPGNIARYTLAGEVLAMAGVLALTAVLVGQDPNPSSTAVEPAGPYSDEGFVGDFHFVFSVDPARPGENTITVEFHAIGDADPASLQRVRLEISEEELEIGPIVRDLEATAPGVYRHTGAELNLTGDWRITLAVRLSDFEEQRIAFDVPIQ